LIVLPSPENGSVTPAETAIPVPSATAVTSAAANRPSFFAGFISHPL
jgi:hypothetical protein